HTILVSDWSSDVCSSDLGRTGEMYRVKGLKFYPSVIVLGLAGISGVHPLKYRVFISRPSGTTDHVKLLVQGNPAVADAEVIKKKIGRASCRERVRMCEVG